MAKHSGPSSSGKKESKHGSRSGKKGNDGDSNSVSNNSFSHATNANKGESISPGLAYSSMSSGGPNATQNSREEKTSQSLPPALRSGHTLPSTDKTSRESSAAKSYAANHLSLVRNSLSPRAPIDGGANGSDTDSSGGAKRGLLPNISPVSQLAGFAGANAGSTGYSSDVPKTAPLHPSSGPKIDSAGQTLPGSMGDAAASVSRSSSIANYSNSHVTAGGPHSLYGMNSSFVMPPDEEFMGEILKSPGWSNSDMISSDTDSDDSHQPENAPDRRSSARSDNKDLPRATTSSREPQQQQQLNSSVIRPSGKSSVSGITTPARSQLNTRDNDNSAKNNRNDTKEGPPFHGFAISRVEGSKNSNHAHHTSVKQSEAVSKEGVGFAIARAAEAAGGGRGTRGNMFHDDAAPASDRRSTRSGNELFGGVASGAEQSMGSTTPALPRKAAKVSMSMEVEVDEGGDYRRDFNMSSNGGADGYADGGESGGSRDVMPAGSAEGLTAMQRRQFMRGRAQREEFFGPIPRLAELVTEAQLQDCEFMDNFFLPGAPCSWLCCAALALSYTTGVPVTMESILHVNRMSVHNISLSTVTLAVMFDTTMDYINNRAQDLEEMLDEKRYRESRSGGGGEGNANSLPNRSSDHHNDGTSDSSHASNQCSSGTNSKSNSTNKGSSSSSSSSSKSGGGHSSSDKNSATCEANRGSQAEYTTLEKIARVRCKMATFDTELYESTAAELETLQIAGENPPVSTLAQFRKELLTHINDENSLYVFNYNPYVVEQSELHIRSNMADTDEEMEAIANSARYTAKHPGTFGILLDFNATAHTVTIATPHLTSKKYPPRSGRLMQQDKSELPTEARRVRGQSITGLNNTANNRHDPFQSVRSAAGASSSTTTTDNSSHSHNGGGSSSSSSSNVEDSHKTSADHRCVFEGMVLEIHMIPLQTFYESVSQVDPYTGLSRGYIQVYSLSDEEEEEEQRVVVPTIFPLLVLDGSSSGGLITSMLDVSIAPHILGLAMMHYLSITFLLSSSSQRKQSSRNLLSKANVCDVKLRGIPLTKVIQQLYLPVSMVVSESNRSSVPTAFVWYSIFLAQLKIQHEVYIGLILPERRGNSADGEPNIDEDTFRAHLRLVIRTTSVMLIGFNVNLALNVTITQNEEPAHFAIVIGFDETHNVVRLADVNVNRFRKTWNIPFERLYNATMGYGYIVAAKDKKTIRHLNAKEFIKRVLRCARYGLPPPLLTPYRRARFEYPARPYAITVLADAVERLGFESDTERFLNFSGYHVSYFFTNHLPLEGAVAVLQNYSHYALDDAMTVTATHYNYYDSGNGAGSDEDESAATDPRQRGGSGTNSKANRGGFSPHSAPPRGGGRAVPHRRLPLATRRSSTEAVNPWHHIYTPHDLQRAIQAALKEPERGILLVHYDRDVIADSPVWNGSDGGDYAIVLDWDERNQIVTLSDANPATFYRTFACPLLLLFRATCSWKEEHQSSCGTILLSRDSSQATTYENTRGYDMAHALVHHPFRPIFSATCNCLALAATEMMMNLEMPDPVSASEPDENDSGPDSHDTHGEGGSSGHHFLSLRSRNEEDKRKYQRYNNVFSAEDILYTLPSFNINDWKTRASDTEDVVTMANRAFAALKLPLVATDALSVRPESLHSAHALLETCKGVNGLVTVVLVLYDTDKVHGIPGTSMALVNRVEEADVDGPYDTNWYTGAASMQLVEGDPCRWGVLSQRSAEELLPAVISIIYIEASENASTGNYK